MLLCREAGADGLQLILGEVDAPWPLALNRDKSWLRPCSNNAPAFCGPSGRDWFDETGFCARCNLSRQRFTVTHLPGSFSMAVALALRRGHHS